MQRLGLLALSVVFPAVAHATDLPCGGAERGTVTVDGLLDDWSGVDYTHVRASDGTPGFSVRCNFDDKMLYLVFDVADRYLVRTKDARSGEDQLHVTLGALKLRIFPAEGRVPEKIVGAPQGTRVATSLQPKGWSAELGVPLQRIPGFHKGTATLPMALRIEDGNSKATLKVDRVAELGGNLAFAEGAATLDAFLRDRSLSAHEIFLDRQVRTGKTGARRLLLIARTMALLSDAYVFVDVPFSKSEVKSTELRDLKSDGSDSLIVRYVERGGGGMREVLAIYSFAGGEVKRLFAAEVAKSMGDRKLSTKVTWKKRGKLDELMIEATKPQGATSENWQETPADDMTPIPLPWAENKSIRFVAE